MLMGARLVVGSCRQYLAQFTAYKGKYTTAFLDDLLEEIKAAELMPDMQARGAEAERSREELKILNRNALSLMQDLKSYIREVYAEYQQKSMFEAAGSTYIERANQLNWDATRGMLVAMVNFMGLHQALLEAGGANMPPSFLPSVQALRAEYDTLYEYFLSSREMATVGAEDRATACNDIYAEVIVICDDGKKMFRDREGVRMMFVWDDILLKVAGPGTQGLKGYVVDGETTRGIMGAELYFVEADLTLIADEDGRFQVLQLGAGEYAVKVSAEGYANKTAKMSIQTGTVSSFRVALESLEDDVDDFEDEMEE